MDTGNVLEVYFFEIEVPGTQSELPTLGARHAWCAMPNVDLGVFCRSKVALWLSPFVAITLCGSTLPHCRTECHAYKGVGTQPSLDSPCAVSDPRNT